MSDRRNHCDDMDRDPHSCPPPELIKLARTLAEWAADTGAIIYLYGSRVRGDHRHDSDVDICIDLAKITRTGVQWWMDNNEENFATINAKLGHRLEILELHDDLRFRVFSAQIVYQDRNVRCVWLAAKRLQLQARKP